MLAFYNNFEEAFYQCPFVRSFRTNAGYATFIKYLVIKKIGHFEDERRIQHCSVIATRSLVQKKEDQGAFIIPCIVGLLHFAKALCDLGQAKISCPSQFTRSWVSGIKNPLRCGY